MSFDIVSENTVAGADVDGIHFVAVDERVLRHDVPLWGFGVGQGKEVRSFAGHKGVVMNDWNRKRPKFQGSLQNPIVWLVWLTVRQNIWLFFCLA